MQKYSKAFLAEKAKELSVPRDTLEKVFRLHDILRFFSETEILYDELALKGGTAINLLFFDLPRLSVDIDLDFCRLLSREEMLSARAEIKALLGKYMSAEGYALSAKSKTPHSLDSLVYDYVNAAGMRDNIKIEINYSLRAHVLPVQKMEMKSRIVDGGFDVTIVAPLEIYAAKTVALMTRAAARDLYDLDHMVRYGLFDEKELEIYRKCVIFYLAIATNTPLLSFDFSAADAITPRKIAADLKPVLRNWRDFHLDEAKSNVLSFLNNTLYMREQERLFLRHFQNGQYSPELLFEDKDILKRIEKHPMAIWKTERNKGGAER